MKKIIIAPLNWGLGHATRCIPIINALIANNFIPIIASDGNALTFLQKEFPDLESLKLPSYNISYAKNVKWSLFLQLPKIIKAVQKEHQVIANFITKNKDVIGIISDNRFGVRNKKVPSVYLTHQLTVLSGCTTFLTSKIHQKIISKFDECWIPDTENHQFSGRLSSTKNSKISTKYIGVLSRFQKKEVVKQFDVLVILSGVEPQRTLLENRLLSVFKYTDKNVVFIQGQVENQQKIIKENGVTVYNFMLSKELETTINQSELVVCRSGYSSIMDLAVLQKKVFFIPTEHQTEQEYLAFYAHQQKLAPFCKEKEFTIKLLEKRNNFYGLSSEPTTLNADLFRLFHCK